MRFTVSELLRSGSHHWEEKDIDIVIKRNLEDLCRKVNALGYTPPMIATSCLRSIADQKRINPKALGSSHLYGAAVDIADPQGKLANWLQTIEGQRRLVECGLWMENPKYTQGKNGNWVHLSIYMPKSANRYFIP